MLKHIFFEILPSAWWDKEQSMITLLLKARIRSIVSKKKSFSHKHSCVLQIRPGNWLVKPRKMLQNETRPWHGVKWLNLQPPQTRKLYKSAMTGHKCSQTLVFVTQLSSKVFVITTRHSGRQNWIIFLLLCDFCEDFFFLVLDKTQYTLSKLEWHLLLNRYRSLTTCWCDPSAPWSLSALFCSQGMQPLWPRFVAWCGFPRSPSKGYKWPSRLFLIWKQIKKDAPRHCYRFSSCLYQLSPFLAINDWKKRGGFRERGAENPTCLPGHLRHLVWIPWSTRVRILR